MIFTALGCKPCFPKNTFEKEFLSSYLTFSSDEQFAMSTTDRHRMDRSLDEIAAEMNSGSNTVSHAPFGEEYGDRDYVGAPIRGSFSSSKRHTPYSSERPSGRRDRVSEKSGCKIFVANLSFSTTPQAFREHMRKGTMSRFSFFLSHGFQNEN